MRRRGRVVLLLAAMLVSVAPPAGAADTCEGMLPGLGARLLEVPTHLADDERARSSIIDEVQPGATIERTVRFSNGRTDGSLELAIAPLPAAIRDGSFLIGDAGADDELADWTSVDREQVTLGPCEHVDVTATIRVPGGADGGERYAAIAAEHTGDPDDAGVTVASRIAVRVYLQVAGPEPATSDFVIDALVPRRAADGRPVVDVVVVNTGERAVDVSGELELTDGPGGLRVGPVPTGRTVTLAPGDEGTASVAFDPALPAGPWRAEVEMRSGELERRAEARLTFPEEGAGEAVAASPLEDRGLLIPLATGLVLLALLLIVLIALRRRREDEPEDGSVATTGGRAGVGELP